MSDPSSSAKHSFVDTLKHLTVDVSYHVFILAAFLSIFYYLIISTLLQSTINSNFDGIGGKVLYPQLQTLALPPTQWGLVKKYSDKMIEVYSQPDSVVELTNNMIKYLNVSVIIMLLIIVIAVSIIFRHSVSVWQIIAVNIITFIIVGIIEYLFFMKIASKYVPVTNDQLQNMISARVAQNLA
jgi:hypothetical protein